MVSGRPNPYLLPTDTTFRFALLIVAVLGSSLFAYQMIFLTFHDEEFVAVLRRCGAANPIGSGDITVQAARSRAAAVCRGEFERSEALWMLMGVAALALTAIALALALPWLRRRRGGFEPVSNQDSPELVAELARLQDRAGVPNVTFLMAPFDPRTSAVAFGRPGARRIVLRGGLITTSVTYPPVFRSVVLHELAHVRNRDIDQAYAAVCVSAAFVLAAVLPFLIILGGSLPLLSIAWRLVALASLVYLLLHALLRSRELYADARVVEWGGGSDLAATFARMPSRSGGRLARVNALHPSVPARVESLDQPRALFGVRAVDGLVMGVTATLAAPQVTFLVGLMSGSSLSSIAWGVVPFAPLISAVLVVGIWRQQYAAGAAGWNGSAWPVGVGLGVGMAIGTSLALTESASGLVEGRSALYELALRLTWAAVFVALVAPLAAWIAEGASVTFGIDRESWSAPDVRRVRWLCGVAVGLGAFVLGGLMYRLESLRTVAFSAGTSSSVEDAVFSVVTTARTVLEPAVLRSPVHVLMLVAWLLLPWVATKRPWSELKPALGVGALVGLIVPVTFVATTAFARDLALRARWPIPFVAVLDTYLSHSAQLTCLAAAGLAALLVSRRPLAVGGVAAAVAGLVGAGSLLLTRPAMSCIAVLTTGPATTSCPSFSSRSYVDLIVPFVLAGGLAATAIALPVLASLAARLLRLTWAQRLRAIAARPGLIAGLGAILAIPIVLTASHAAVDRAARTTADVKGSIGDNGVVAGTGYRLRLVRGWLDVTAAPNSDVLYPGADRVIQSTAGQGVIVIAVGSSAGAKPLAEVAAIPELRSMTFPSLDGEETVALEKPGGGPDLDMQVLADHQGRRYGVYLLTGGEDRRLDRRDVRTIAMSWEWL